VRVVVTTAVQVERGRSAKATFRARLTGTAIQPFVVSSTIATSSAARPTKKPLASLSAAPTIHARPVFRTWALPAHAPPCPVAKKQGLPAALRTP
jgi:hypothetical protein